MLTQAKNEENEKTRIPLPKGNSFRLEDVFKIEICGLDDHRSLLTLRVIFFPPDKKDASPETDDLVRFLKSVRELLLVEIGRIEWWEDYSILDDRRLVSSPHHWLFGPFSSYLSKSLPTTQVESYLSRLVPLLKNFVEIFPDDFGEWDWIRRNHGANWLEKALAKGILKEAREEGEDGSSTTK
jgi:hypothetical protein